MLLYHSHYFHYFKNNGSRQGRSFEHPIHKLHSRYFHVLLLCVNMEGKLFISISGLIYLFTQA